MCGIGGFVRGSSELPGPGYETVKNTIIRIIEDNYIRGTDAAGMAALKIEDGEPKIFYLKAPEHPKIFAKIVKVVDGWEKSNIIIVHDRAYTTCHPRNNLCNHPLHIKLTDGSALFLVHNGVIRDYFRHDYDVDVDSFRMLAKYEETYKKELSKNVDRVEAAVRAMKTALSLSGPKAILAFHVWQDQTLFYVYRYSNPLKVVEYRDSAFFSSIMEPLIPLTDEGNEVKDIGTETLFTFVFGHNPWELLEARKDRVPGFGSYSTYYGYSYKRGYNYEYNY